MKPYVLVLSISLAMPQSTPSVSQVHTCDVADVSVTITAQDGFQFDTAKITVEPNQCLGITYVNAASVDHELTIEDHNSGAEYLFMTVASGNSETAIFLLPSDATTLDYYCSIPGHRDAGMAGEIIVGSGPQDECDTPTKVFEFVSHRNEELNFVQSEFFADKGECVEFDIFNEGMNEHTFHLERNGDALDIELGHGDRYIVNIQLPNEDVTLDFWDATVGHQASGEYGTIVVGNDSPQDANSGKDNEDSDGAPPLPGFDLWLAFIALLVVINYQQIQRRNVRP